MRLAVKAGYGFLTKEGVKTSEIRSAASKSSSSFYSRISKFQNGYGEDSFPMFKFEKFAKKCEERGIGSEQSIWIACEAYYTCDIFTFMKIVVTLDDMSFFEECDGFGVIQDITGLSYRKNR